MGLRSSSTETVGQRIAREWWSIDCRHDDECEHDLASRIDAAVADAQEAGARLLKGDLIFYEVELRRAVAEEREACALLACLGCKAGWRFDARWPNLHVDPNDCGFECTAKAIRARTPGGRMAAWWCDRWNPHEPHAAHGTCHAHIADAIRATGRACARVAEDAKARSPLNTSESIAYQNGLRAAAAAIRRAVRRKGN